jgi:lipopolysaccharide export system protein LptA
MNSTRQNRETERGRRRAQACWLTIAMAIAAAGLPPTATALESDRQQPLFVNADSTGGSLGDGETVLRGNVDIRQGTLHIRADEAAVAKRDGKVRRVILRGNPAFLEQEIEEQGLVQAEADTITYQVRSGLVKLTGNADVRHPQYQISGDTLTYDLDTQHFRGSGQQGDGGRIRIQLDPEVAPDVGLEPQAPDTGSDGSEDPEPEPGDSSAAGR